MSEATDRPAEPTVAASITQSPPADPAPRGYSSVSIVAILGLVLSALYALLVGPGAFLALFNHTPWILPIGTFVLPVVAVAVCFAARARIRRSEGALTGTRLTTWGVGLAAVVGLLYAAYYAGCYFAVSSQAEKFTNEWMDLVRTGKPDKIDQAFLYTLQPPRPADDESLRDHLEMDRDRGQGGHGGMLTGFRQCELVRQFEEGGGDARVEFLGVERWGYDQKGYSVALDYRVTTPAMVSDMVAVAVGRDDENGDRQWTMMEPQPLKAPVLTAEGEHLRLWDSQAREFAEDWLGKVEAHNGVGVYLDTLPPADRERQKKELGDPMDARLKAFHEQGVVRYDPDMFWVGPKDAGKPEEHKKLQEARADRVRGLFAAEPKESPQWILARSKPEFHREGDTARIAFNIEIMPISVASLVPADKPPPQADMVVQGMLVLTADLSHGDPSKDDWRVEALNLISAKSTPAPLRAFPERRPARSREDRRGGLAVTQQEDAG